MDNKDIMCYFTMDTRPWNGDMRTRGKWADWRGRFATIILSHQQAQKFHRTTYVTDEFGKHVITKVLKIKPDHIYTDIEGLTWSPFIRHPDEVWAWGKFHTYERMAQDGNKHSVHLDDDFILWRPINNHIRQGSCFQSPEPIMGERKGAYLKYAWLIHRLINVRGASRFLSQLPQAWIDYARLPLDQQIANCVSIAYVKNKDCLYDYAKSTLDVCHNFGSDVADLIYEPHIVAKEFGLEKDYLKMCNDNNLQQSYSNVVVNCYFEQWGLGAFMHKHNVKPYHIFKNEIEIRNKKGVGVHHVWGGATKMEYVKRILTRTKEMYPKHFPITPVTKDECLTN